MAHGARCLLSSISAAAPLAVSHSARINERLDDGDDANINEGAKDADISNWRTASEQVRWWDAYSGNSFILSDAAFDSSVLSSCFSIYIYDSIQCVSSRRWQLLASATQEIKEMMGIEICVTTVSYLAIVRSHGRL